MSGDLVPLSGMLPALVGEARRRRLAIGVIFAAIALTALAVGAAWPKKYEASTTILAQEASIITPLMEGAAAATGNKNRAGIARDVIFSRKVLDEVMATGGWLAGNPSPIERDKIMDGIKARTKIVNNRENLITISYFDSDPKRAFEVTRAFGQLFISESLASKQRESREAYEFINSQVEAYRTKLTDAEDKLKAYRDANADARPGSETDTNARISQLRTQIENNRMDYMQKQSQAAALSSQLNGESEVNAVQTVGGIYATQLADLQGQLSKLLLNYTDDYPDVVRLRHQIEDLRKQAAVADAQRASGGAIPLDHAVTMNPVYQQMRLQLSAVRSDAAASAARVGASEAMLQGELERSKRIANSENVVAELTRDYTVNRDVYQDLLKRRENARVSMNLDAEQRGLTFLVQNPAMMPLVPSGLRFMHFGLAGLALSLAIPFGLLFAVARFDPRVRSVAQLERATGFPVLASVPFYPTPRDRRRTQLQNMTITLMVFGVGAVYLLVFWLRMKG
ncbi:polysaccharide chain length determinant protein, PEP-CTERM locus subfamily [Luteibacter sp. UNCMF331Sha3.1]|uniref:XrtA system polysaccharide chain length determinant n=1 Tax=Luteibacter sp. UNCMF331Sha3.1 TaxID=1502760 RepID=UPI0008C1D09B|nr:XrtA system polysaccharide chain length determinant [Luteibacter sp. UNCMF331Sha3.1]SEN37711.1 polysaccharide chain length determinant protein, PEP-CTERM locus subfamily [Luteibacter sp. UNCMF331Sha3.1]